MILAIEKALDEIVQLYQQQISSQSTVTSIYLFGSYIRGDFILDNSDLDFAIFLDLPESAHHWNHPDFLYIYDISKNIITSAFPTTSRKSPSVSRFDCVSFSLSEVHKIIANEPLEIIGPLNRLTFFAFDFLQNRRLLWGKDILKVFPSIPDPLPYKIQRINWMKTIYLRKKEKNGDRRSYLLMSLGSIISYVAILDGLRDVTKKNLRIWCLNSSFFTDQASREVITKYFNFILDQNPIDILDTSWVELTEHFIENFFKNEC